MTYMTGQCQAPLVVEIGGAVWSGIRIRKRGCCVPAVESRLKRCGRCARIFCTKFQVRRSITRVFPIRVSFHMHPDMLHRPECDLPENFRTELLRLHRQIRTTDVR